jgi:beta-lactamase class A
MVTGLFLLGLMALSSSPADSGAEFAAIENRLGGQIGVVAIDTESGQRLEYRPNERFKMCSTFKFLAVAAVLKRVDEGKEQLDRFVQYGQADLLEYAPVTKQHLNEGGMKLEALCAAAIKQSDNTAANLLLTALGGPNGVTKFARDIGDQVTRLDQMEPELNVSIPGDDRDTTTPAAICESMRRILTTEVLSAKSREQLETWLVANETGADMIRAAVPKNWKVGDKTGRSSDGTTNDIAILRPPGHRPIFIAVYSKGARVPAKERLAAVADAAGVVIKNFAADATKGQN